ncbi:hypothetical protein GCM10027275_48070 [Rhabdobacter roseus]|uniref:Filamentous hemagglutinin n=1 Tax=Rhabdobacter roseus TaxID=1655419 RepID=A0A840U3G4_9BACT|nr:filamentous hemagglutinin [Rhabdobacter roseus]MBB5286868.1 hypothetical protein [Rhabdobacter roseus]
MSQNPYPGPDNPSIPEENPVLPGETGVPIPDAPDETPAVIPEPEIPPFEPQPENPPIEPGIPELDPDPVPGQEPDTPML